MRGMHVMKCSIIWIKNRPNNFNRTKTFLKTGSIKSKQNSSCVKSKRNWDNNTAINKAQYCKANTSWGGQNTSVTGLTLKTGFTFIMFTLGKMKFWLSTNMKSGKMQLQPAYCNADLTQLWITQDQWRNTTYSIYFIGSEQFLNLLKSYIFTSQELIWLPFRDPTCPSL